MIAKLTCPWCGVKQILDVNANKLAPQIAYCNSDPMGQKGCGFYFAFKVNTSISLTTYKLKEEQ